MSDYVIVTDSALDMDLDQVEELGVHVLPINYTVRGENLKNLPGHPELPLKEFYQLMRDGEMVTTSAINAFEYEEGLTPILESGKDILLMVFDRSISETTFRSASMAAEELREKFPERKIIVGDTRCVTAGLYLLLWYATDLQKAGKTMEEVWQWCEDNKFTICHLFTVEDLTYLRRGGRISAASAVVGGMLNIKPILHVDHEGFLVNIEKARGRKAALRCMVDLAAKTITNTDRVVITHGDCLEEAQATADAVREATGVRDIRIGALGPVIGAHTGPGIVVVSYIGTERG